MAQPANIGIEQYNTFRTHDIFVAEGGLVIIPGHASTFNFGLPEPTCTFACLAETYLFASSGITNHSAGALSMEFALEIEQLADECGLLIRPLDTQCELHRRTRFEHSRWRNREEKVLFSIQKRMRPD